MRMEFGGKASSRMSVKVGSLGLALLASTAIYMSGAAVPAAHAQQAAMDYSVPAGPLGTAISRFGDRSNLQVLYPADLVRGKSSPGVSGSMTPGEALNRLLAGTGLSYSFTNANTVTITDRVAAAHDAPVDADGSLVLDTITISGGGSGAFSPDTPYETAGSSTYISGENIERFRGTSPADMLRSVPGLTTTGTNNGGAINANIRGMQDMDRAPVVVDGALQSQTEYRGYAGAANRSYIDPDLIGGVSVERGPSLGADAGGATGGVVRMRTLNAEDIVQPGKNWGLRLKGGYTNNSVSPPAVATRAGIKAGEQGNFDRPSLLNPSAGFGSIAGAFQDDRFEFLAAYSRRKQGNYFAGRHGKKEESSPAAYHYRPGEEVLNTSNDSQSFLAKGAVKLDGGHRLELSFMRYDSDYSEMLPSRYGFSWGGVPQNPLSNVRVNTYTGTYTWNPEDNDLINLRANVWKTDVDQLVRDVNQFVPTFPEVFADAYTWADRWGGSVENTTEVFSDYGDLSLTYGASFNRADTAGVTRNYFEDGTQYGRTIVKPDGWRKESSAFVSSQYRPFTWLKIDTGIRYTHTESHDNCVEGTTSCSEGFSTDGWAPIAAVTVEPWQGLQGYVRYAEAIRSPSIYETLNVGYPPTEPLKPEHAKNWEVGVNVLRDDVFAAGDKLRFNAAWFKNNTDDYLTRRAIVGAMYTMANLKSAMFEGIELSASYDNGRIFAEAAYDRYLDNEFCLTDEHWPVLGDPTAPQCSSGGTSAGYNVNHIPPKDKFSLTLGTRLFEEKLTLGGRVTYVGKPLYQGRTPGGVPAPDWDPYTLVDLFASYKFNETAQLDFSVDNVTDRFYIEAIADGYNPGPGRTFRLSMTTKF